VVCAINQAVVVLNGDWDIFFFFFFAIGITRKIFQIDPNSPYISKKNSRLRNTRPIFGRVVRTAFPNRLILFKRLIRKYDVLYAMARLLESPAKTQVAKRTEAYPNCPQYTAWSLT